MHFNYVEEQAVDRLNFYSNNAPVSGNVVIAATLYPVHRDFVWPARVLTAALFGFLAIGAASDFINQELDKLHSAVEAIAVITLFIPTAVVAYLWKADEHELRWRSLRRWRRWALFSLIPLIVAVGTLLPESTDWADGALKWIWTGLAVIESVIALVMWYQTQQLLALQKEVERRQGLRREWTIKS
jgi:cell division protein FtsW (lipid II flippase)